MTGVELLIVGWIAQPVIKAVFDKAQKFLSGNYQLQKDTEKMVIELTITLLSCEAIVTELQKIPIINNRALADWLRELKEAVYHAEDVLDNIEAKSNKEKLRGEHNEVWKFASSSFSTVRNMVVPADDLKRLKMVRAQLKKLSTDIPNIVISLVKMNKKNESHTCRVNVSRETISQPLGNVGFHGREDEMRQILDIIKPSESESRHIIPIVGMGGVGKTALAQAVYNSHMVQQTFNKREWISVSNKPDVDAQSVLREINQSLGYESFRLQDIFSNITLRIGEIGKFLIVLDGIFEIITSEWEYIEGTLSHCAPGSVVLITTQNPILANRVATSDPIALSTLNSDKYWELFESFAFGNQMPPNLKPIGREIAAKLHGLPLAAKIIGNHLRTNVDEVEWRKFLKNEWWKWNIREVKSEILPSIGLGYEQLNPSLRQCFAYCSVFPRNSLIERDRLIHMWIAQNFIHSDANGGMMNLEDIGRQWFNELVKKYFFQRAEDDGSYVMHDLMHDLAVIVSSGECLYLGEGLVEIPWGTRHLAVHTHNPDVIKGIRAPKNLRSFLYTTNHEFRPLYSSKRYRGINKMLSDLGSIRVLDLSGMWMGRESEPPSNMWKLNHLRFLDLSSTGIKRLTSSRIGLYHLQVLYIQNCELLESPSSICQARIYQ